MDHSLQKAAQRKAGIAARRALPAAARSAADAALCRRIAGNPMIYLKPRQRRNYYN